MKTVSPIIGRVEGLRALEAWLLDHHYSPWSRRNIVSYLERTGELAGAVDLELLDREDEATATEVYVDALGEVPGPHPDWADESVYLDADSLLEAWDRQADEEMKRLEEGRPVPDPEPPYEPTDEDLADLEAWLESVDAKRTGSSCLDVEPFHPGPDPTPALPPIAGGAPETTVEEMRAWYDRHPLSEFNAIRPDGA